MPKRNASGYNDLVDLSFLPENVVTKISSIFNAYFGLGVARVQIAQIKNEPRFPNQLASLTSTELSDVFGLQAAWQNYVSDKLKYVKVAATVVNNEVTEVYNAELAKEHSSGGNIKTKEAKAKSAPGYIALLEYKARLDNMCSMLEADAEKFANAVAALSREIARRESNAGF